MSISTLFDIKEALSKVPDALLDNLRFGCGENCETDIGLIATEGQESYDFPQVFDLIDKQYPQVKEVEKLIKNIGRAQDILNKGDKSEELSDFLNEDNEIDSEFDFSDYEDKKSSSNQLKQGETK